MCAHGRGPATSGNLSRPVSRYGEIVRVTSCLSSKLLVLTSLDGGSGDETEKVSSIAGVGSARLHLMPMFRAATELDLNPRVLSLDVDRPSILTELGHPDLCVIGKINHFDDSRVEGFAMATLGAVARLKARKVEIALLYCDHLAPLKCARGMLYRDLLNLADRVIVPCQAMADRSAMFLSRSTTITIVEDPWQVSLTNYRNLEKHSPLRLGWFGNANNVLFLCEKLADMMRSIDAVPSIDLVVLTNEVALNKVKSTFHASLKAAVRIGW